MPKTYFSADVNSAAESWRMIRSFRADPPHAVKQTLRAGRTLEFQMALQQAQQQFTAATSIGYESRPLNLYYGIAQAGRALAAASPKLGASTGDSSNETWKPSGHGLKFNTAIDPAAGLFGTDVRTTIGARDLFSRVSIAVGSPLDFNRAVLGELMSQLPEFRMEFGTLAGWLPELHDYGISTYALAPGGRQNLDIQLFGSASVRPTAEELRRRIDRYPSLREYEIEVDDAVSPVAINGNPTAVRLGVATLDQLELDAAGAWWRPPQTTIYRRHAIQLPAVGDATEALRPLMNWWMLLYALSMVARYAPSTWSSILAISRSPIASQVEHLLDMALAAVPDLVAEELQRLGVS